MSVEHQAQEPNRQDQITPIDAHRSFLRRIATHSLADVAMLDGFVPLRHPESNVEIMRVRMRERIIEQDEAIDAIANALDGAKVRLDSDHRPIATLAFLGPTGVGKSQTAKVLAELGSDDATRLVKIDCSNFSSGHEIAKLTGSPPGYVSREQEPFLSKKRVERKGTVVLFDEIEKGSPELFNLMLQIMGDGDLQLNNGEVTSFQDAIIILTSNLGAQEMSKVAGHTAIGFGSAEAVTDKVALAGAATKAFDHFFSPEFRNRLDKVVVFHPLSENGLKKVLDVKLQELNKQYEPQYGVRVSLSDATQHHLVTQALKERHLGARPLVRALHSDILSTFGRYIGNDEIRESSQIRVFHRTELPDGYLSDERELVFASKNDTTIRRQSINELVFQEPSNEYDEPDDENTHGPGNEIVGPVLPTDE